MDFFGFQAAVLLEQGIIPQKVDAIHVFGLLNSPMTAINTCYMLNPATLLSLEHDSIKNLL